MSGVSYRYSHAAPYIRRQLVYAVSAAEGAKTKRDRLVHYAEAGAFAQALEFMAEADDQTPVDGIAEMENLPSRALMFTRKFLGGPGNVKKILGIDMVEPKNHEFVPGDGRRTWADECQHPGCGAHQSQHEEVTTDA